MKLVIQIPCLNEEKSLPVALSALPKKIPGIQKIEILIIDDGSKDGTIAAAKKLGVKHFVRFPENRGLAAAFTAGLDAALKMGADIIVNTDADNQYVASDIAKLVAPILKGEADFVIGARPISKIKHFSPVKKLLQKIGSAALRVASGTPVKDAPSGFRAFSREAAMKLNVFNPYTYTLETLIQAGHKSIIVKNVDISINDPMRPSRLFRSISTYVRRSLGTIIHFFLVYKPALPLLVISAVLMFAALLIGSRFLWYYFHGAGAGHIQSLILMAVLILIGVQCAVMSFMADLLSINRRLLEDIQFRVKKLEFKKTK